MGVVKNLMVRAGADFSAITKQANKAKSSMKGMHTSISKSCSGITAAASKMNKVLGAIGVGLSVTAVVSAAKSAKKEYDEQAEASAKLAQVMRNTMGARSEEIKSIEDYIDALERTGVVTGDVQTAGAQELATYLQLSDSLKTLIPVMNDMVAQQYGIGASAESAVSIATMLGKVMNGQTSALSRYGYSFTAAQEAVLKYGTEAQRAAVLAEVVGESVGGMNAALAATPNGRLQQVSNTLGRIKESFGQAVNQVLVLFIPVLNTLCGVLERVAALANQVAQTLSNVFGAGASGAAVAVKYTGAAASGMNDLTDATEAAGTAAEKSLGSFGFDTLNKMTAASSGGGEATDTASIGSSGITEMTAGVDEAGESVSWLEKKLSELQKKVASIKTGNLVGSLQGLKDAVSPLTEGLFSGLSWALDNILVPLAGWTVESGLPAFLDALGGAASVLSETLTALQPVGTWLWENFLQPIAGWTGEVIVAGLESLSTTLHSVSEWISQNQGVVQAMAITAGAFCGAWTVGSLAEFLVTASSLPEILSKVAAGLTAATTAKIADKVAAISLCAEWVKLKVMSGVDLVKALGAQAAAWVATTAKMLAGKVAIIATTAAEIAHTTAATIGTAVTTAFGVAMNVLTSPITLVIAAIAALIAIVVLLVKNWDWVKETAAKVWEGIKSVWSSVSTWFKSKVIDPLVNGFKGFANGVIGFFEGLVNGGIRGINKLIGAFNKISFDIPGWVPVIGGKKFGFNIPLVNTVSLPRLATGTVVDPNHEFAAILGDNRHEQEVVSPLSTMKQAFREELDSSSSPLLDQLYDIYEAIRAGHVIRLDKRDVGRTLRSEERSVQKAYGR